MCGEPYAGDAVIVAVRDKHVHGLTVGRGLEKDIPACSGTREGAFTDNGRSFGIVSLFHGTKIRNVKQIDLRAGSI